MPPRRSGARPANLIRGGRPQPRARGVVHRPAVRIPARRALSPRLIQTRNVRRQQARVRANQINLRPRPVVRPKAVPRRVMAKPRPAKVKRAAQVGRVVRPAHPIRPTRMPRPTARAAKRNIARGITRGAAASIAGGLAAAAAVNTLMRLNASRAHPDIVSDVSYLQSSLDDLQEHSSFSELRADIANLDANLNHALSLLESAREKEYKYQKDLEEIAYDAMSRWQEIRNNVEASIEEQYGLVQSSLRPVNSGIDRLNVVIGDAVAGSSALDKVENEVRKAMDSVYSAERTIESAYADIEAKANLLISRLTRIHWALTQRDEASFAFDGGEDLYMAVAARWDQEGKNDPEGVLFLTNQRLIFEQKEKIATKKVLFITTASELVQKLTLETPVKQIKTVKARNKGVFGHQDFLDVDFSGKTIPIHLNGQDSDDWARMILDSKSGKIEEDRATGSGLSFADLTGELTEADIIELQNEVNELQDEMMLKAAQDELAELENEVSSLSRELAELRARGYVVEKTLEADVQILTAQWEKIKQRSTLTLEHQTRMLGGQMSGIQASMAELAGMTGALASARPLYTQIKSSIASAEAQAEAAEQTVLDQFDEYADEVESLDAHFEWVDWMLDALSTASFKLLATESGVAAAEAAWQPPSQDPENGILFLTDQRLLWEDREGGYEVRIEVPLAQVEEVKAQIEEESDQETLVFTFGSGSGAPVDKGRFILAEPVAEEWLQMAGRARSGDYASDRAVEIKESELERIRSAPDQCPNCGAAFTSPVLRGQNQLTCEFCGVVTRI